LKAAYFSFHQHFRRVLSTYFAEVEFRGPTASRAW
jgi:hypothetical protein